MKNIKMFETVWVLYIIMTSLKKYICNMWKKGNRIFTKIANKCLKLNKKNLVFKVTDLFTKVAQKYIESAYKVYIKGIKSKQIMNIT